MDRNKSKSNNFPGVALAVGAHPDDIEFMMGGTLLLLKAAGYETHYINIANGNCGSQELDAASTAKTRREEARQAAEILGASFHESLCNDLEILYTTELLRRLTAVIREIRPAIVLTHSPGDYMEDHINTCRLAVTAAFSRGMPNFETIPSQPATSQDVTVYHALPYGLKDGLGNPVSPGIIVNTTSTYEKKLEALACHKSQQGWLDVSQGMNSYLQTMEEMSLEVGMLSGRFKHAEGWQRHTHLGFCVKDSDPLSDALGESYFVNKNYEK
jgi:LmbE family N-acetylglucosaminyl deacetylase